MISRWIAVFCFHRCGKFLHRKLWLAILLVISLIIPLLLFLQIYVGFFNSTHHRGFNYSAEVKKYSRFGYLLESPTCSILNISAWDESILLFLHKKQKSVNCGKEKRRWTYTHGADLIINTTSIEDTGFSPKSVSCCYMKIIRMENTHEHYDRLSDGRISFSNCTPLTRNVTHLTTTEFVRVLCKGKYWPFDSEILYRNFHALPLLAKNSHVKRKVQHWKTKRRSRSRSRRQGLNESVDSPPNFLILGIDSMSRLGFQRNMPNTQKVLEEIGAIEMLGYTKVGENTFPNAVAFLSGYSEEELKKLCYFTRGTLQDKCPYVWKRFSSANYLTAFIEDVPLLSTFNYMKTGFVEQPVDYYFRPFMLAAHGHSPAMTYTLDCIGERTVDETLLDYMSELHTLAASENTPLFIYAWLTNLAHEDLNVDPYFDNVYANFLKSMDLTNTVLILMSDHGYRFGEIRETFPGWYEDKLPTFWTYLPKNLVERFPSWKESLVQNSRRLTSPYDLYHTMSHFLDVYTKTKTTRYTLTRKYGQSLFTPVPFLRECQDAGISSTYCACVPNSRAKMRANYSLAPNDAIVIKAAKSALTRLNSKLPKYCFPLTFTKVTKIVSVNNYFNNHNQREDFVREPEEIFYILAFLAQPGEFRFETSVSFTTASNGNRNSTFMYKIMSDVIRINKISTDISCVIEEVWEKFCYCSFLHLPRD